MSGDFGVCSACSPAPLHSSRMQVGPAHFLSRGKKPRVASGHEGEECVSDETHVTIFII